MKGKALLCLLLTVSVAMAQPKASRYFQLNVYSYSNQTQEQVLEQYLQNAFVPTAHALGFASVGVFKAIANDTAVVKKLYVLLAAKSAAALLQLPAKMLQHKPYTTQAATWLNHEQQQTAYDRIETILLQAFAMSEGLVMPNLTGPRSERVYELRSYESSTEALYRNKVHMFNEGDETITVQRYFLWRCNCRQQHAQPDVHDQLQQYGRQTGTLETICSRRTMENIIINALLQRQCVAH